MTGMLGRHVASPGRRCPRGAGTPGRRGYAGAMRVSDPVGRAVATALAAGTAVRGARIFHPDGVATAATLTVTPTRRWGCPLLDEPATNDALVRLSRGVGPPPGRRTCSGSRSAS